MERILKNTPLIYALLVFIGFVDLRSYYGYFGIEIWTYLSVGELLLSFLPRTIPIMLVLLAFVAIEAATIGKSKGVMETLISVHLEEPVEVKSDEQKKREAVLAGLVIVALLVLAFRKETWRTKATKWSLGFFAFVVPILMVLYVVNLILAVCLGYEFLGSAWWWAILAFLWIPFFLIYMLGSESTRMNRPWRLVKAVVVCAFCLLLLWAKNAVDAQRRIDGFADKTVSITTESVIYQSSENLVYVGKCNTAIFLYDRAKGAVIVVPMDEVKYISMSRS